MNLQYQGIFFFFFFFGEFQPIALVPNNSFSLLDQDTNRVLV